jgi:hypothetical protein
MDKPGLFNQVRQTWISQTTSTIVLPSPAEWESVELLTATSVATDVRGAPIDPVARRLWGVPVVLNHEQSDDVGLIIAQDVVTVDHDPQVEVKGQA